MIGSCEHYYGYQMPPVLYGQPTHPMSSVTNCQVTKCGWVALLGPGSWSPLMKLSDVISCDPSPGQRVEQTRPSLNICHAS